MKWVVALAIGAASVGAVALAQSRSQPPSASSAVAPSPNAFVYWHLVRDSDGASLVSDRDYHAPEGLRVTFSCKTGDKKKISVREYLNSAERTQSSLPLSRRDRLQTFEQCDATCARHSDSVLRDVVDRPAQLQTLRPTRYAEASITWKSAGQKLVDRYALDATQFGDAKPASVQAGLAKQKQMVAQFKDLCGLK